MQKIGFIDYYLDEFHANHYPEWIKSLSKGELEVCYAYAECDSPTGRTTEDWCGQNGIRQVKTIEELVEKSDCLVVLSPDNPERHESLCRLPLASGKRVYVDKTFAEDRETALRIFKNAESHGTPCFSSSALRFASEYSGIEKDNIQNLSSWGPGSLEVYSIHQIEPIVMLMGAGAKRVLYTGTEQWPALVIEFNDGRRASLSHHGYNCPFSMVVDFAQDSESKLISVKSDYFGLFVSEMADFFLTGKLKASHEETVAVISIREAGIKASKNPGQWISVG